MEENPFPTRLVLRLLAIPIALAVAAIVEGSRGCHRSSSGPSGPPATQEEIVSARVKNELLDKARRDAIGKATTTVVPRPDLGPCQVRYEPLAAMKKPTIGAKEAFAGYDVPKWEPSKPAGILGRFEDELVAIEDIGISYAEEASQKPGPRWFRFESTARGANVEKSDIDRAIDISRSPVDYQLVIDKEIDGKPARGEGFESGILIGRVYIWDHEKAAIVCAARVAATSSDELDFRVESGTSGQEKLARILKSDLRERALAQAKDRLYVAGPILPSDGPADPLLRDSGATDGGKAHGKGADAGRTDGGPKP